MPAAVALVSTPDAPPDDGPRAGQPYLTPVPDCEPPFDDELVAVSRIPARPVVINSLPDGVRPRLSPRTP